VIVGIDARIPIFTGRGWGRYTCEIIEALAATEELELRVLLPRGTLANALAERVRTRRNVQAAFAHFEPSSPDHYWEAAGGIKLEAVLGRVDLLHSPTRFILPTDIRPLVATVHDVAPLSDPPFKPKYRDATLRAIEYIRKHHVRLMTVSEFTRQELRTRAGLDVEDVVVVHHGVSDVFLATQGEEDPPRDNYLLYVGGAGPNKNLERLIASVRLLREGHRLDLVIAGDRSWDHEELRRALGPATPSWIRLSGYVTDQELAGFYRNAAVCVFPSLHEGFGLPVIEAMACGTPLACSRIPVLEEVARNAAVYFNPFVVEDIAAAVRSLLEDRRLSSELVSRGRIRARKFTWANTAQKTIEVYRKALEGDG
jgi:glycosyltransferase involved in cell wall biosynthesis